MVPCKSWWRAKRICLVGSSVLSGRLERRAGGYAAGEEAEAGLRIRLFFLRLLR